MNPPHAHRPGPEPRPPTRIVVSGGPNIEPHLYQDDEKPGVGAGVIVWVVVALVIAILALAIGVAGALGG